MKCYAIFLLPRPPHGRLVLRTLRKDKWQLAGTGLLDDKLCAQDCLACCHHLLGLCWRFAEQQVSGAGISRVNSQSPNKCLLLASKFPNVMRSPLTTCCTQLPADGQTAFSTRWSLFQTKAANISAVSGTTRAATVRFMITAQSPNEFRPSGQSLPEPSR